MSSYVMIYCIFNLVIYWNVKKKKQRHTQWKIKYKIKSKWVCFSIEWLIDFMEFNLIFNIISVISQHPVQVSMLCYRFFYQNSTQYSF